MGLLHKASRKASGLKVAVISALVSAGAFAAPVTFDASTKSFTGDFDLAPYYSAIGITVAAIAVVASIGLALKSFRRV